MNNSECPFDSNVVTYHLHRLFRNKMHFSPLKIKLTYPTDLFWFPTFITWSISLIDLVTKEDKPCKKFTQLNYDVSFTCAIRTVITAIVLYRSLGVYSHLRFIRRNHEKCVHNTLLNFSVHGTVDQIVSVNELISLHIRSMWETICNALASWSGWEFGSKIPVYPILGFGSQNTPLPPKNWNLGRSWHLKTFQFWLVENTPSPKTEI